MLLVFWLLELVISAFKKFFIQVIMPLCFVHTSHDSTSTSVLSCLSTSHLNHESVWWSRSYCAFHLLKVITVICLLVFLALVERLLLAIHFQLDIATYTLYFTCAKEIGVVQT